MQKKNFDIVIYGHLSYDNIYNGFDYSTSIGCAGNVWLELKKIDPNLKVHIEPIAIGESLILVDEAQGKRTSVSCLNQQTRKPNIVPGTICHIMYINELDNISFINELDLSSTYVTADVCNGKKLLDSSDISSIDLMFMSDEDACDLNTLTHCPGHILLHKKDGSHLRSYNINEQYKAEVVDGVNVLGMGDRFAANVLYHLLQNDFQIDKCIQPSHDAITAQLKKIQSRSSCSRRSESICSSRILDAKANDTV